MNPANDSIRKPRVLVLTPRYPYPVVGGDRLRIHEMCKVLALRHELTLLSLCESREELTAPEPQDGVFTRTVRVYLSPWRSRWNVLRALVAQPDTPLQVAYYRSSEFAERIAHEIRRHDMVLAHLIRTGDYVRGLRHPPVILEMTDAIGLNYERVSERANLWDWKAAVYRLEAARLKRYERRIVREVDCTVLVSDVDKAYLMQGEGEAPVMVCSNGVDIGKFRFQVRQRPSPVLAFIGNMTTLQNQDACRYFIADVLPLLRRRGPFVLRIVGRASSRQIREWQAVAGVEIRANVADVQAEVSDALAGVAPVRLGAGIQNKVLEYMAMGLPAVVSTLAWEGLKARPQQDLLIADDPQAWVDAVVALWDSEPLRQQLAMQGRDYVEQHHAWGAQLAPLVEAMGRFASRT